MLPPPPPGGGGQTPTPTPTITTPSASVTRRPRPPPPTIMTTIIWHNLSDYIWLYCMFFKKKFTSWIFPTFSEKWSNKCPSWTMQYVAKQPGWFMSSFSLAWRWLRLLKVTTKRFSQDQPSFTTPWTSSRMELSDGTQQKLRISRTTILFSFPIGSMYAIYGNIYHQYTPNVSIYTIHGSYGFWEKWWVYQGTCGSNVISPTKIGIWPPKIWRVHPPKNEGIMVMMGFHYRYGDDWDI